MTIHVSKYSDGVLPIATPDCAGDVVANLYEFDIAGNTLALNDIIDVGVLPAYATVVDAILISDDLDTNGSPTVTLDVGLMSGEVGSKDGARTCGAELFAASNVAQAGGTARMSLASGFRIASAGVDRSIGIKIKAAIATQATTGKVGLLLLIKQ